VIDPTYLATIRSQLRCELVVVLVQLEQLCPGWWADLAELAEQLGTDRATLNRALQKLERLGLLRRERISNTGGNWIWWVKRAEGDQPRPEDEPSWRLRDTHRGIIVQLPISKRWEWAERHDIPRATMRSFLNGHHRTLGNRWQVVRNPWEEK
jgi:hypothetical protein